MRRTSRNSEKCDDRPLHAVVVIYLILAFERDPSEVLDPNISQDTVVVAPVDQPRCVHTSMQN